MTTFATHTIQGVKKVQIYNSIANNFRSYDLSILILYRFQELLSIQVSTKLQLLQLYIIIVKLAVHAQRVILARHSLLILHIKADTYSKHLVSYLFKTKLNERDCVDKYSISYSL